MNSLPAARLQPRFLVLLAMGVSLLFGAFRTSAELRNVEVGGALKIRNVGYSESDVYLARCVWGLVDKEGTMLIEPTYAAAAEFSEGLAAVTSDPTWSRPRKWGFLDKTGHPAINFQYDGAGNFSDGLAAVKTEAGWGYIDRQGEWVIDPQFDGAGLFHDGAACASVDGAWGVIDRAGKIVVPLEYDATWDLSEGLVCVRKGERFGFANLSGTVVVPLEFESVSAFHEGVAPAKQGGAWGLIDKQGSFVVEPQYTFMDGYSGGIFCVVQSGRAGVIDARGDAIIPIEYGEPFLDMDPRFAYADGLLQLNVFVPGVDRVCFDLEGRVKIELHDQFNFGEEYAEDVSWQVGFFHEGRARLQVRDPRGISYGGIGAFGFIDKEGEVVVAAQYADVRQFSQGVAWVAAPRPEE